MNKFKLLVVEDNESARTGYQVLFDEENPNQFEVIYAKSKEEATTLIAKQQFDGAVVDLKLRNDVVPEDPAQFEGNDFIESFTSSARCPVIVFTANPMNLTNEAKKRVFRTIDRGDGFAKVIEKFKLIHKSGLSEIMNKGGLIDHHIDQIYWDVIAKRINTWTDYAEQGKPTKDALLRLILNHLIEFVGQDNSEYFPDEAYLKVFDESVLKTGQLYKNTKSSETFIIISPACDLSVYDDGPKSEFVQLCRIYCHNEEPINSHIQNAERSLPKEEDPEYEKLRIRKKKSKSFLKNAPVNGTDFYHYLPKSGSFKGGVINFREINSVEREKISSNFSSLGIQVSPPFLKDIVGRYSSYYARQGQPVFGLGELSGKELLQS